MAESEEELRSLLLRVKEERKKAGLKLNVEKVESEKVGLKLNIQKTFRRSWHQVPSLHGK